MGVTRWERDRPYQLTISTATLGCRVLVDYHAFLGRDVAVGHYADALPYATLAGCCRNDHGMFFWGHTIRAAPESSLVGGTTVSVSFFVPASASLVSRVFGMPGWIAPKAESRSS